MNRFGLNPANNQTNIVVDEAAERSFITRVYSWMALALAITGLVATATASNAEILKVITGSPAFIIVVIAQIVLVVVLSAAIGKLSASVATGLFIVYAALTGLTFSLLFMVYTAASIGQVFFITAGTFALVSAYGYITRRDLTSIGNLLFMGLIGILLASVVNIFLQSSSLYWVLTILGVVVFVGLIAYDTQRIKRMAHGIGQDGEMQRKAAVIGALALYLDFINLFIRLLRLFGRRR
jgi:FtsH-binding integral membrane protein